MIYFNYDVHLKATLRFTVILMEMTCKKYAKYMSKYRLITAAAVQVTEWLFFSFRKIPRRATAVESYFSTVTVLAILLKQDPTKGVFMKTFQNFQNRYFLSNTFRGLVLNLQTILIVPAPFFLPYLYVGTRGGKGLTSSGFCGGNTPG